MSDGTADVSRRGFLRAAAAGAAVAGASGTAAAAEEGGGGGGGEPDYGGWLDPTSNFDGSTVDATGQDSVTITVGAEGNNGNFAFGPPAVHVDAGTTVVWEWNGQGGEHNVVEEGGAFESELTAEEGFTFEQTFDEDGIVKYYCNPHRSLGMVGAVVVGTDYPTAGGGGGGGASTPINPEHMGVPFQAHFVGLATILAIVVSLVFVLFQLKYGESANTKGGND